MSRGAESTIGAKLELPTTNSPAVSRIKDACQEDLKCAMMSMLWLQHMLRPRPGHGVTHEHVMNCSEAITPERQQLTWRLYSPKQLAGVLFIQSEVSRSGVENSILGQPSKFMSG